jgi:hypothetical protein
MTYEDEMRPVVAVTPELLDTIALPVKVRWQIWDRSWTTAEVLYVSPDGSVTVRSSDGHVERHSADAYIDTARIVRGWVLA